MLIGEFKAWLEGFEEGLQGKAPNKAQWKKIKERLEIVDDKIAYQGPYWWPNWYCTTVTVPAIQYGTYTGGSNSNTGGETTFANSNVLALEAYAVGEAEATLSLTNGS